MMLEVSEQDFTARVLDSERPVLVDFWAPWCGPCKMVAPILEELEQDRDDLEIVKVNIDDNPALAAKYGVMSIPTMILFKGSAPIGQVMGAQPRGKIEAAIDQALA